MARRDATLESLRSDERKSCIQLAQANRQCEELLRASREQWELARQKLEDYLAGRFKPKPAE